MRSNNYDRISAKNYATFWALKRNPKYYNFDRLGGDCTNFVSQCIFAGAPIMNYTPTLGWFYNSLSSRSPAWSGVNELFNFLTNNNGLGPYGKVISVHELEVGDVVQLGKNENDFYHALIVSQVINGRIFVCSHTRDALNIPLENYSANRIRQIKILGYKTK